VNWLLLVFITFSIFTHTHTHTINSSYVEMQLNCEKKNLNIAMEI
jgi:hypothetical protein